MRWVRPRVVVEVSFVEWTRDGNHPEFVGVRADKKPRDVKREACWKLTFAKTASVAVARNSIGEHRDRRSSGVHMPGRYVAASSVSR